MAYSHLTGRPGRQPTRAAVRLAQGCSRWLRTTMHHVRSSMHGIGIAGVLTACFVCAGSLRAEEDEKPASPREMFRNLDIGDRYFDRLADGQAMGVGENETLWRVMLRLRIFPLEDIEHWAIEQAALKKVVKRPQEYRGSIFQLRGKIVQVEPIQPPPEAVAMFELPKYYRCRIEIASPPCTVDVLTTTVPMEWRKGVKPNVEGGAFGVFLKIGEKRDGVSPLIAVARRVAYYPDGALGRLGMDYGLFDAVRDGKTLSASDREAFYQMLAAVGRAEPGELLQAAEKALPNVPKDWRRKDDDGKEYYSVTPLFNEAASQRGRLVELKGTARRIEHISVNDPDMIARFGIREYYQMSLFTDDSQGYPVTVCVRELPYGMPYGNRPHYGETVRVAGFFFKTWSYAVPKLTDGTPSPTAQKTTRQYSPLLIARSLTWYPAPPAVDHMPPAILLAGLAIAFMVVIWIFAWINHRREARWLERMESTAVGGAAPDFSRLAEFDQTEGDRGQPDDGKTDVTPYPADDPQ